jgi:hypothetical protein
LKNDFAYEESEMKNLRLGFVGSYRPNFTKDIRSHHIKSNAVSAQ